MSLLRRCWISSIGTTLVAMFAIYSAQQGMAIPPLKARFAAAQSRVAGSLTHPYRVAIDLVGNVYISNSEANQVLKETLSQGTYTQTVVASTGLSTPYGVAVDQSGNVYIVDSGNNRLMKEAFSSGSYIESTVVTSALNAPTGVAVDQGGNIYIADTGNGRLLKETPFSGSYSETVIASSGLPQTVGVAVDSSGDVFVSDIVNQAIYEFSYSGGSYANSTIPTSGLSDPYDIAVDGSDNLYITDVSHSRVLKESFISAGTYTESIFPAASLVGPHGLATDAVGDLYIADTLGQDVKKMILAGGSTGVVAVGSTSQIVSMLFSFEGGSGGDTITLSGISAVTQGAPGLDFANAGSGTCAAATYSAGDICYVDATMTPRYPGQRYGAIELLASGGIVGSGYVQGVGVGPQINFMPGNPSNVATPAAPFNLMSPFDAAVDASGNVFLVDYNSNAVYEEVLSGGIYTQHTVASGLGHPEALALDGLGNVYIADGGNDQILKASPSNGSWTVTAVATGLHYPTGVAVDGAGTVYFTSYGDSAVFLVATSGGTYSTPTAIVGGLRQPRKLTVDSSGAIYIADTGNSRVLLETWGGSSYTQSTLGSGLSSPWSVAVSANGSVFIADFGNQRIVEEALSGGIYTQSVAVSAIGPVGVQLDQKGNIYEADDNTKSVILIDQSDAPSLTFQTTVVGATSADSPRTVTLSNVGNADLDFEVPGTGNNPSIATGFSLASGSANNCPLVAHGTSALPLAPGANCTIPISFEPVSTDTISGTLTLLDNHLNASSPTYATQIIDLSGQGTSDSTTTTASNATAAYSATAQTVALSATVSSSSGTVNSGTVTFTVLQGPTTIGSPLTSSTVVSGYSTVNYALPGGTALGTYTIQAAYNPGGVFIASSDASHTLTIEQGSQTINFTQPSSPVTFVPGLTISLVATGGPSGIPVVFTVDASSTAAATISGSTLTVTGAGNLVVDANQAGNVDYTAATQAQVTVVVDKAAQTINFTRPASPVVYSSSLTIPLVATSGASGIPIVFTVDPSSTATATIAGNMLSVTGVGTLVIDANQAGNNNYTPASQVQATLVITLGLQSITFTQPSTPVAYTSGLTIPLVATGGGSGNPVSFTIDASSTASANIAGNIVSVSSVGTVVIDANQAANNYYLAASQVQVRVVIIKGTATVALGNLSQTYNGSPESATATTTPANLTVVLTYNGSSSAPTAAGSYAVIGTINDPTFQGSATGTLVIAGAGATVILGNLSQTYTGVPDAVTASTTPEGLGVAFTYNGSPAVPTSAGSYVVVASINSANWSGSATGTLVIAKAASSTTIGSSAGSAAVANAVTLTATVSATSGIPTGSVTFLDGSNLLGTGTLSGGIATFTTSGLAAGTQSITVDYGGDVNFLASSSAALSQIIEDFNFTTSSPSVVAPARGTAVFIFNVTPVGGSTFPAAISLSLSGLPAGATYSFSPASIAAEAGITSVTLTVDLSQTSASASRGPVTNIRAGGANTYRAEVPANLHRGKLAGVLAPLSLAFILLPIAGLFRRASWKLSRIASIFLLIATGLAGMAGTTGCVANIHNTSKQSYAITVTGASGALSHSATSTLTIQ